jgi:hypothetical protein
MKTFKQRNKKCNRIQVGKSEESVKNLKFMISKLITLTKATTGKRGAKGSGIINEIEALLHEVPLGRYKLEICWHRRCQRP